MNCKNCKNPLMKNDKGLHVNKDDKRYGICNACLERMEEDDETLSIDTNKTSFLKIINFLQLIGFIIMAIMCWTTEETIQGFVYLIIGLIIFAFIKGFIDIIDLLTSINDKLK